MRAVELALLPVGSIVRYKGNTGKLTEAGGTVVIQWDHINRTSLLRPADPMHEDIIADLSLDNTPGIEPEPEETA